MLRTAILATASMMASACSTDCANTAIARADGPDGLHSAVMFRRSCGATTGFSTQISVVKQGRAPSGGGNAFRADANHGAAAAGHWGGPWAEMQWLAPDRLLIRYAAGSRLFERQEEVAGIEISYQEVARWNLRNRGIAGIHPVVAS